MTFTRPITSWKSAAWNLRVRRKNNRGALTRCLRTAKAIDSLFPLINHQQRATSSTADFHIPLGGSNQGNRPGRACSPLHAESVAPTGVVALPENLAIRYFLPARV